MQRAVLKSLRGKFLSHCGVLCFDLSGDLSAQHLGLYLGFPNPFVFFVQYSSSRDILILWLETFVKTVICTPIIFCAHLCQKPES